MLGDKKKHEGYFLIEKIDNLYTGIQGIKENTLVRQTISGYRNIQNQGPWWRIDFEQQRTPHLPGPTGPCVTDLERYMKGIKLKEMIPDVVAFLCEVGGEFT